MNARITTLSALTIATIAASAATPAFAGDPTLPWNRKALTAAVTDAPDGSGKKIVTAYWQYSADTSLGQMDLSARVQIMAGGAVIWEEDQIVGIADGDGPCPQGQPCGQGCGIGTWNGASVPLTCVLSYFNDDPAQGSFCSCSGPICPVVSAPVELAEDVDIIVIVKPLPGAEQEFELADDMIAVEQAPGGQTYWDTEILSMDLTSSPGLPGGFFDVHVEVGTATNFSGFLPLGYEVVLMKNGQPVESQGSGSGSGDDWIQAEPCGDPNNPCGQCGINNFGGTLECDLVCNECIVVEGTEFDFIAIPMDPNDDWGIKVQPAPGALPSLPGFEEDDQAPVPVPGDGCPADLDGDGFVGSTDLNALLGSFGLDAGGDCDNDGDTDSADLNILLGMFGESCFPV